MDKLNRDACKIDEHLLGFMFKVRFENKSQSTFNNM